MPDHFSAPFTRFGCFFTLPVYCELRTVNAPAPFPLLFVFGSSFSFFSSCTHTPSFIASPLSSRLNPNQSPLICSTTRCPILAAPSSLSHPRCLIVCSKPHSQYSHSPLSDVTETSRVASFAHAHTHTFNTHLILPIASFAPVYRHPTTAGSSQFCLTCPYLRLSLHVICLMSLFVTLTLVLAPLHMHAGTVAAQIPADCVLRRCCSSTAPPTSGTDMFLLLSASCLPRWLLNRLLNRYRQNHAQNRPVEKSDARNERSI